MASQDSALVIDKDGLRGTAVRHDVERDDLPRIFLRLENGRTVMVEKRLLRVQPDGTYYLPVSLTSFHESSALGSEEIVLPVIEESIEVHKHAVEKPRLRISKHVNEREVLIDEPLMQEHVDVKRVVVNRVVDEAPEVRYEGDTMIVPVMEEVVVVDVRLVVREELHITRQREETHAPQRVTLRREEVVVEALDDSAAETNPPVTPSEATIEHEVE